ncbi:LysR family transcriptional regulator [Vibrio mimicus]|uniref:LysR family transcriptional regulator n=1 Tax=Vibrio mimicus TaxID=674 RepID=UPI002FF363DD
MKTINRTIDVKYLRTFSQVAKHKSFTAAAESLFMTQPAVSQHIKKIESVIGASIFDRKDGFGLTKHGKVLLEYADQTMSMYEKLFEDLERVDIKEQVNIAIADSFSQVLVERVISEFRLLNNTDLSISGFSSDAPPNLQDYDLIFSFSRLSDENGKSYQLNTANYVVAHNSCIDPRECYPERIVYCHTLNKTFVQEMLTQQGIDLCRVKSWMTTSSSRLMKSELNTLGTVVICPRWSIHGANCRTITLRQQANMYVWCNDEIVLELDQHALRRKICMALSNESYCVDTRKVMHGFHHLDIA